MGEQCCKLAKGEMVWVEKYGKELQELHWVNEISEAPEAEMQLRIRETYENHRTRIESLCKAVHEYYRAMQQEIQKQFLVKVVLVGGFQNALQTKVQITMFSLNYSLTGDVDVLFFVGVVGNLLTYLVSISDCFEFFCLCKTYFGSDEQKMTNMLKNEHVWLRYNQYETRARQKERLNMAYVFGIIFTVLYIVFWLYQVCNFLMIFVCESHMWNIGFPPSHGCTQVNRSAAVDGVTSTHTTSLASATSANTTPASHALPPQWLLP